MQGLVKIMYTRRFWCGPNILALLQDPIALRVISSTPVFASNPCARSSLLIGQQLCGGFSRIRMRTVLGSWGGLQGHLAHKKLPPHRTLQEAYARDLAVVLGGGQFLATEVPLHGPGVRYATDHTGVLHS